ncbi:MAG: FtsB family cell division protein [Streptosporangiaceae bacterium]
MSGRAGRPDDRETGPDRSDRPGPDRSDRPGASRPGPGRPRLTGRSAILALVLCAIALSLAYPVREYISQRRQIDQLQLQQTQIAAQLKSLRTQRRALTDPAYVERIARDQLHMCLPSQTCYVIVGAGTPATRRTDRSQATTAWYSRLWSSVRQANAAEPAARPGKAHPGVRRAGSGHAGAGHRGGSGRTGPGRG